MARGPLITTEQIKEMYRLRKEGGYNNCEIANKLGISEASVRRYIANEDGTTHRKMPTNGKPVSNLKIVHQQLTVQGERNVYQVNPIAGIMTFREVQYSKAELLTMIEELTELVGMMGEEAKQRETINEE
jgi:predicted transcriptional regulator